MPALGISATLRRTAAAVLLLLAAVIAAPAVSGPALAQQQGEVPGEALGNSSDSQFWRAVRSGDRGSVSIPDKKAGVLIQSEGDNWRAFRNGPLSTYGVWGLAGIIALLALFFLLRGRIRIQGGRSGRTITRFGGIERFSHWLTAVSFLILAFTGLNTLYGRYFLKDAIGASAFGTLTQWSKWLHNYVAFAFMIGLVLIFVLWVVHNIPNRHDLVWLAKGGGMFSKNTHVHSKKFNAGQKIIFWLVILFGVSISLSGLALLFPFQLPMFAKTFEFLNVFGFELPTQLTAIQEMQLSQLWHTVVGLAFMVVVIAHIYIGTIGMEGAFAAMGSGQVDTNWAREHHDLWYQKVTGQDPGERGHQPAE